MTKRLAKEIKNCSDCPYCRQEVVDPFDAPVEMTGECQNPDNPKRGVIIARWLQGKEQMSDVASGIHPSCPLPDEPEMPSIANKAPRTVDRVYRLTPIGEKSLNYTRTRQLTFKLGEIAQDFNMMVQFPGQRKDGE